MSGGARGGAFRPDIEGLRGIAILLVLAFHADLAVTAGGFVGVDVFFVISGFLITGLLLREHERSGRIAFRAFYARRVRRLLPAGLVALAIAMPIAWLVTDPLDRPSVALDGIASALSIGNIRFALAEGDYFTSMASPSPFLHYWSLGIEEQFYLVWPALLFMAARGRRPRLGAGVALAVVLAASFAANVLVTDAAASWAFYSLPTRAWQLSLGGLLAVAAGPLQRIPGVPLAIAGWAGLAAVAASVLVLDPTVLYPGVAALLPTLGAAALVASGGHRWGPGRLLAIQPLRFLGRISYSLYLWHWPILVLVPLALGAEITLAGRLGLVGVAILVAAASCLLIEEPFRESRRLAAHPLRTLVLGASMVTFVVALGTGLVQVGLGTIDAPTVSAAESSGETSDVATLATDGTQAPMPSATASPPVDPSRSIGPSASPSAAESAIVPPTPASPSAAPPSTAGPSPTPRATGPVSNALPADVRPKLSAARSDSERLVRDGCLAYEGVVKPPHCVYGDPHGAFTVALIGDSHASDMFPAVEAIAKARAWRLLTFVKVSCPFIDMPLQNLALKRPYPECAAFRDAAVARLQAERPDLVIVGFEHVIHPANAADGTMDAQVKALAHLFERLPGRVAVLVDHPRSGVDVPACLSAHRDDIRKCAVPRSVAFLGSLGTRERAAAAAAGAGLVDLTQAICPSVPCPVVIDRRIVFRDNHHLTATFAASLATALDEALDGILPPTPPPSPSPAPASTEPVTTPFRSGPGPMGRA